MSSFRIIHPTSEQVPILLSIPHCGVLFPDELKREFKSEKINQPDDTDWFVDRLYDFAPAMGITIIQAVYSRWVIDLNRDPDSKPLYTDGRIITDLCPVTDFLGNPIYSDERKALSKDDRSGRIEKYFQPYHHQVQTLLVTIKEKFGKVLLWDCHSIRQQVLTIQKEKFPDLILGDADGTSASPGIIEAALSKLDHSDFSVRHNFPFKGGYITRHYGKPAENIHALQLEMTKVNYMHDDELTYHKERAEKIRSLLKIVFGALTGILKQ
ncbi:MAG: N-formylglutamate deformylase [Flammeovirgaceae bacterium]|nr:N-formylglutamate deformylase [Flammeovirgaceae bacterium]